MIAAALVFAALVASLFVPGMVAERIRRAVPAPSLDDGSLAGDSPPPGDAAAGHGEGAGRTRTADRAGECDAGPSPTGRVLFLRDNAGDNWGAW